jgi:hypothetical protein
MREPPRRGCWLRSYRLSRFSSRILATSVMASSLAGFVSPASSGGVPVWAGRVAATTIRWTGPECQRATVPVTPAFGQIETTSDTLGRGPPRDLAEGLAAGEKNLSAPLLCQGTSGSDTVRLARTADAANMRAGWR